MVIEGKTCGSAGCASGEECVNGACAKKSQDDRTPCVKNEDCEAGETCFRKGCSFVVNAAPTSTSEQNDDEDDDPPLYSVSVPPWNITPGGPPPEPSTVLANSQPKLKTEDSLREDPVDVATGSFMLDQVDISLPTPTGALTFTRHYRSRSRDRSILGSNWTHNYDIRLVPLHKGASEARMLAGVDLGRDPEVNAVVVYDPERGTQRFYKDDRTGVFVPSAGSTDTLTFHTMGWYLLTADGTRYRFGPHGYLLSKVDRFGAGYTIGYEETPEYEFFSAHCASTYQDGGLGGEVGVDNVCSLLAYQLGYRQMPDWTVAWGEESLQLAQLVGVTGEPPPCVDYPDSIRSVCDLLTQGPFPELRTGDRRYRPIRVQSIEDPFIELDFQYAPAGNDDAGLLKRVTARGVLEVDYSYLHSEYLPARLNESLLSGAVLSESVLPEGVLTSEASQAFSFHYDTPDPGNGAAVYDAYFNYFRLYLGTESQYDTGCIVGVKRAPGDPCLLAGMMRDDYLSDVADNIVAVGYAGRTESNVTYERNPWQPEFDRATSITYGGALAAACSDSGCSPSHGGTAYFQHWEEGHSDTNDDLADVLPAGDRGSLPARAGQLQGGAAQRASGLCGCGR